jgi:hypothetical protein
MGTIGGQLNAHTVSRGLVAFAAVTALVGSFEAADATGRVTARRPIRIDARVVFGHMGHPGGGRFKITGAIRDSGHASVLSKAFGTIGETQTFSLRGQRGQLKIRASTNDAAEPTSFHWSIVSGIRAYAHARGTGVYQLFTGSGSSVHFVLVGTACAHVGTS